MTFAAEHDVPIPYMQRTRDYYLTLGYDNPYRWAHYVDVPFTPLRVPLAQTRLALITTAAPYQPGLGEQGPGAPYNAAAKFYKVYSEPTIQCPTCASRTSAMTASTPRRRIPTPGCPCDVCRRPSRLGESLR